MLIRVYIVETFGETTRRLFIESLCRNETFPAYYIVLETHRTVDRPRGPNSSYAGHHQIGSNVSLCRNIVRRPNESYNQKFPVVSGEAMVARGRFELPSMGLFLVTESKAHHWPGHCFRPLLVHYTTGLQETRVFGQVPISLLRHPNQQFRPHLSDNRLIAHYRTCQAAEPPGGND